MLLVHQEFFKIQTSKDDRGSRSADITSGPAMTVTMTIFLVFVGHFVPDCFVRSHKWPCSAEGLPDLNADLSAQLSALGWFGAGFWRGFFFRSTHRYARIYV